MDPLVKKALSCIDLSALSDILIDDVIEAAIMKAVAKSETKIDDAVVGMLLPLIKIEAKKYLADKIAELKA
jgi:hypothetical protein